MSGIDDITSRKIVISTQFGGFDLSQEACLRLIELGYDRLELISEEERSAISSNTFYGTRDISRNDPLLIQIVEELGERANGNHATLKVVEIPSDVEWTIEEYDGNEWIAEKHRKWR